MNSGVTSLNELPSANSIGSMPIQPQNNIVMNTMEHVTEPTSQMPGQVPGPPMETRPQNTQQDSPPNYHEMVNQLQQAIQTGATTLPTKHIPIDPSKVSTDPNIKPNHIPATDNTNYISNEMDVNDLINQDNTKNNNDKTIEYLFNELKLPLLIGLLFFLFQLPTFKKFLRTSLPFLNSKDGNNNIYGYIFNTTIFVTLFYLLNKIINNMTQYVM